MFFDIIRRSVIGVALLAAGCASADSVPSSPSSSGRQAVAAPIDAAEVVVLKSSPPQYMLNVKAGLPSGCAERNRYDTDRSGTTITVTVLNWLPSGNPPCTMIYGTYDLSINLGSDFRSGTTYTVAVNDKKTTFVAQ
jgi:hypothetical protein